MARREVGWVFSGEGTAGSLLDNSGSRLSWRGVGGGAGGMSGKRDGKIMEDGVLPERKMVEGVEGLQMAVRGGERGLEWEVSVESKRWDSGRG